ncbi:MAG TPA: dihydrolipoamide acetyltransferase family protein [Anaerolineae bacterium]
MPKVGLTMTEGSIVQWHKRGGDFVRKGELIFTFETEKSTLEFESPVEGVIERILVPVGQVTACFTPVAVIGEKTEDRGQKSEVRDQKEEARGKKQEARGVMQEAGSRRHDARSEAPDVVNRASTISNLQSPIPSLRRAISPRARMRARDKGIDLNDVNGSRPDGVVLERDVAAYKAPPLPVRATPVAERIAAEKGIDLASITGSGRDGMITREDVVAEGQRSKGRGQIAEGNGVAMQPITPARRITAQRVAESARNIPHVTLTSEADATALVSAREQLNAELDEKVSYNALLLAIIARALREHPQLNAYWADGRVGLYQSINIGIAVDTPRGLYVPVVRDATRPLIQLHNAIVEVTARTMAGNVTGDDFAEGTFTMTNLGMYEIDAFTPIINQPQAAILGVGRIIARPVAIGEQVAVRQMMMLSLSFDHRVVDGAPAAKFLQRVKALIERPFALLV